MRVFDLNGLTRCSETCACDSYPAVPRAIHTGLVSRWFIVYLTKCVCVCVFAHGNVCVLAGLCGVVCRGGGIQAYQREGLGDLQCSIGIGSLQPNSCSVCGGGDRGTD